MTALAMILVLLVVSWGVAETLVACAYRSVRHPR